MKKHQHLIQNILFVFASTITTTALAGSVTIPNTFSSGTPAVAAEVNGNFNAVKAAVDDNVSSITSNVSSIISHSSSISTNITAISSNTTARTANATAITALQAPSGAVSVGAHAFRDEDASRDCRWVTSVFSRIGHYDTGSDQDCDPVAGIQFPDGVTLKALKCLVTDNSGTASIEKVELSRVYLFGNDSLVIFATPASNAASIQQISDTTPFSAGAALVNNEDYAYYLSVHFSSATDTSGLNLTFTGCAVTY